MNTKTLQHARTIYPGLLIFLACVHLCLHLFTNGNYGMFRDEFYYIACSDHLAWGYVDHPPLSIGLLTVSRAIFGDSVQAIRILPALVGAFLVVLAGFMASELGGRRFAQSLAALCVMIAPSYLVLSGFFSMNIFDLLFWAVSFTILIRIITTNNTRLWILLGLVLGFGLMNKISVLFFGFSLVVGLLVTSHRKAFLDKYLWIGGVIAILIFLPHILWQIANDWPTLEFMSNATQYKIAALSPVQFLLGQILEIHPLNFPIWVAGLCFLLFAKQNPSYRILGIMYMVLFIFFVIQKSKVYYLAPVYTMLLAAGACALETWFEKRLIWIKPLIIVMLVTGGILIAPYALPILPVETFLAYQKALGIQPPASENTGKAVLPQHFADRFGWESMTKTVASVYKTLTPEQQADCVIFTSNYGEAGAINYYGSQYDLPRAISGHNNYYLWGYVDISGNIAISVGIPARELQTVFEVVSPAATINSAYAMPYETNLTVYLCSGLKMPLDEVWRASKRFI